MWRQATQLDGIDVAAVLTVVQLLLVGGAVAWSLWIQRRHRTTLALLTSADRQRPRTARQRVLVAATAAATAVVVLIPLGAMLARSLRTPDGYSLAAWTDMGETEIRPGVRLGLDPTEAMLNSLRAAGLATLLAVVIGGLAALAIHSAGRHGRLLDAGLMLPLGTSAVTIGFGMLITFDVDPIDWRASPLLVPIGHALIAVPFVVRTTLGVLAAIDPRLREAAATLGATPTRAWAAVTLPTLWRPLAVGAGLAGAISLGEFGATSFLSRRDTETMPLAIEQLLGRTGSVLQAQAYALAVILAATTVALVVLGELVRDRARRP